MVLSGIAAAPAPVPGIRIAGRLIRAARQIGRNGHLVDRAQKRVGLRQRAKLQLRRLKVVAQLLHGVRVDQRARGLAFGMDRRLYIAAIMLSHRLFIRRFYWFPNSSDYIFIPFPMGAGHSCRVYRCLSSLVSR